MKIAIYDINNDGMKAFNYLKSKFPNNQFTYFLDKDSRGVEEMELDQVTDLINNKIQPKISDDNYDLIIITSIEVETSMRSNNITLDAETIFTEELKGISMEEKLSNIDIKGTDKGTYRIVEFLNGHPIETCLV